MTDNKPLVSIGMLVCNGEKYIRQALDSLLAQDYANFKLIISDNASKDGTTEEQNFLPAIAIRSQSALRHEYDRRESGLCVWHTEVYPWGRLVSRRIRKQRNDYDTHSDV